MVSKNEPKSQMWRSWSAVSGEKYIFPKNDHLVTLWQVQPLDYKASVA